MSLGLLVAAGCVGLALGCSEAQPDQGPSAIATPPAGANTNLDDPTTQPAEGVPSGAPSNMALNPGAEDGSVQLGADAAESFLRHLAPVVAGRVLNPQERALIATDGANAVRPIVEGWSSERGFVEMARRFVEQSLFTSGEREGIDFNLPGNLAEYLVTNRLPWSRLITEPTCYDSAGQSIECDTGAPFQAGVLTTRAFLVSRASRFNLTRSSAIMGNFACRGYPMEAELEPRATKADLIPMFQAETAEEQTDERAASGFGNGFGCYTCHGQFSLHAQLFVKFDEKGLYHEDADGHQDPEGELGRSVDGLMASHFVDPVRAGQQVSRMLGQDVNNLAEAGQVLAASPTFAECVLQRSLNFVLGLEHGVVSYDPMLVQAILDEVGRRNPEPTYQDIIVELLSNPSVILSVSDSLRRKQ